MIDIVGRMLELNMEQQDEILRLRAENEKLRAALKPFADCNPITRNDEWFAEEIKIEDFRAAAAALKETGDE